MALRFGFFLPGLIPSDHRERFAGTYEMCQHAESVGFDFVAMGHHRFTPDNEAQSSSLLVLTAIAARTSTLKLSSSVFLMPLYPALDVAEEIATLDQISDGRTMLSFGIGYRPYEYEFAGLNYKARASRLEEGLQVMLQAWTRPTVHFTGKHYRIEGAPVVPKPVQQPHPPILLGGGSDTGIDRAARLADGWMIDTLKPMPAVARKVGLYRQRAAELERPASVCLVRNVGIGVSEAAIERDWLPDAAASMLGVWQAGGRFTDGDRLAAKMLAGEALSVSELAADRDVAGTPEQCIEQIRRWQEITGCDRFLAMFGERPRPEVLRDALTLFGREVIPAFADGG
jgi:alkanesulfonate monooxygenase SsuD/methylene tetrahydromethanopterin reductase-like flavin-dependent oxidoreductase (luciferase family)